MRAIQINTIIDPSKIQYDELKEFEGKRAQVIVLIEDDGEIQPVSYNVGGSLSRYANVNKVAGEKTAWEKHAKDKYGNR